MSKTKKVSKIAFTPIEDRVLVLPTPVEEVSAGGIVLPGSAQEKPLSGSIVAVGPGRFDAQGKRMPMPVTVGDEVIFGKFSGNDIEFDGSEYKVLRASELLAKIGG